MIETFEFKRDSRLTEVQNSQKCFIWSKLMDYIPKKDIKPILESILKDVKQWK